MALLAYIRDISRVWAVFLAYAAFLAGYFLLPQAPEHYRFYYFFLALPSVLLFPLIFRRFRKNHIIRLLIFYLIYMVISSFWSDAFRFSEFFRIFWYGYLVFSFLMVTSLVCYVYPNDYETMLRALVWLASATATVSIVFWYKDNPFPQTRLEPISRMDHPILAGCVYGFFALLSLHFSQIRPRRKERVFYRLFALILFVTVLLTQSRTAFLSWVIASLLLLSQKGKRVAAVFAILGCGLFIMVPTLWDSMLRGLSFRPGIWQATVAQAGDHLIFGAGYLSDSSVVAYDQTFDHAHSAYLATLRDGGLVGLSLLILILGLTGYWAFKLDKFNKHPFYLVLLIYGMLCAVPDLDRLLTRPKEHWLFFWLPIALITASYQRMRNNGID